MRGDAHQSIAEAVVTRMGSVFSERELPKPEIRLVGGLQVSISPRDAQHRARCCGGTDVVSEEAARLETRGPGCEIVDRRGRRRGVVDAALGPRLEARTRRRNAR